MPTLMQNWLLQSAVIFLIVGSIVSIAVGASLMFWPQYYQRLGAVMNRWISTRNMDRLLESSMSIDSWIYRYRRVNGALIAAGAVFVLYYFAVDLDRDSAIIGLAKHFHYPLSLVSGLLDALVLSSMLGALCAIFVALFMLFRPSLLRDFEQDANQWLSLRKALKPMEIPRDNLDGFVRRHTRRFGAFIMLGGLYALVFLSIWLIHNR